MATLHGDLVHLVDQVLHLKMDQSMTESPKEHPLKTYLEAIQRFLDTLVPVKATVANSEDPMSAKARTASMAGLSVTEIMTMSKAVTHWRKTEDLLEGAPGDLHQHLRMVVEGGGLLFLPLHALQCLVLAWSLPQPPESRDAAERGFMVASLRPDSPYSASSKEELQLPGETGGVVRSRTLLTLPSQPARCVPVAELLRDETLSRLTSLAMLKSGDQLELNEEFLFEFMLPRLGGRPHPQEAHRKILRPDGMQGFTLVRCALHLGIVHGLGCSKEVYKRLFILLQLRVAQHQLRPCLLPAEQLGGVSLKPILHGLLPMLTRRDLAHFLAARRILPKDIPAGMQSPGGMLERLAVPDPTSRQHLRQAEDTVDRLTLALQGTARKLAKLADYTIFPDETQNFCSWVKNELLPFSPEVLAQGSLPELAAKLRSDEANWQASVREPGVQLTASDVSVEFALPEAVQSFLAEVQAAKSGGETVQEREAIGAAVSRLHHGLLETPKPAVSSLDGVRDWLQELHRWMCDPSNRLDPESLLHTVAGYEEAVRHLACAGLSLASWTLPLSPTVSEEQRASLLAALVASLDIYYELCSTPHHSRTALQHSRSLLTVWTGACLADVLVRGSPRLQALLEDFAPPLDPELLQHLLLRERRWIELAQRLQKYLAQFDRCHRKLLMPGPRGTEDLLELASRATTHLEKLASLFEEEVKEAQRRNRDFEQRMEMNRQLSESLQRDLEGTQKWAEVISCSSIAATPPAWKLGEQQRTQVVQRMAEERESWQESKTRRLRALQRKLTQVQPLPDPDEHEREARAVLFCAHLPEALSHLSTAMGLAQLFVRHDPAWLPHSSLPAFNWLWHYREFSSNKASAHTPSLVLVGSSGAGYREPQAAGAEMYADLLPGLGVYSPAEELRGLHLLWHFRGQLLDPFAEPPEPEPMPTPLFRMELPQEQEETFGWMLQLPPENETLSRLPVRPPELTSDEFKTLGCAASCSQLHLRRILSAVAINELPLGHPCASAVLRQALYRLGPFEPEAILGRSAKADLEEIGRWPSCAALVQVVQEYELKPKAHSALFIIVQVLVYLSQFDVEGAADALESSRSVLEGWAEQQRTSIEALVDRECDPAKERLELAFFLAYFVSSFQYVSADHLCEKEAIKLATYRAELSENLALSGKELPRDLARAVNETMCLHISSVLQGRVLSAAVRSLLQHMPAPEPSAWEHWDASPWRHVMTVMAGRRCWVSLHALLGLLLQDGRPVGCLPREIAEHPLFKRTFGRAAMEVRPLPAVTGCELYAAVRPLSGRLYCVGLVGDQLLVEESEPGEAALDQTSVRTLIPAELLSPPVSWRETPLTEKLLQQHSHWYSEAPDRSWAIAFRGPLFNERAAAYRLQGESPPKPGQPCAAKLVVELQKRHLWVVPHRPTGLPHRKAAGQELAVAIVRTLCRVEPPEHIECLAACSGSADGRDTSEAGGLQLVQVRLLRLQLSFELSTSADGAGFSLVSNDFPKHRLAKRQEFGGGGGCSLRGFECFLLYEPLSSISAGPEGDLQWPDQTSVILVPKGHLSVVTASGGTGEDPLHRASITWPTTSNHRSYLTFELSPEKGRITASTRLGRLMLAFLHWATSSPIPDAVTGRTGYEQALHLLRSSWQNLPATSEEAALLRELAGLVKAAGPQTPISGGPEARWLLHQLKAGATALAPLQTEDGANPSCSLSNMCCDPLNYWQALGGGFRQPVHQGLLTTEERERFLLPRPQSAVQPQGPQRAAQKWAACATLSRDVLPKFAQVEEEASRVLLREVLLLEGLVWSAPQTGPAGTGWRGSRDLPSETALLEMIHLAQMGSSERLDLRYRLGYTCLKLMKAEKREGTVPWQVALGLVASTHPEHFPAVPSWARRAVLWCPDRPHTEEDVRSYLKNALSIIKDEAYCREEIRRHEAPEHECERLLQISRKKSSLRQKMQNLEKEAARLEEQRLEKQGLSEKLTARHQVLSTKMETCTTTMQGLSGRISEEETTLGKCVESISVAELQLAGLEVTESQYGVAQWEAVLERWTNERRASEERLGGLRITMEQQRKQRAALATEREEASTQLAQASSALEKLEEDLSTVQVEKSSLQSATAALTVDIEGEEKNLSTREQRFDQDEEERYQSERRRLAAERLVEQSRLEKEGQRVQKKRSALRAEMTPTEVSPDGQEQVLPPSREEARIEEERLAHDAADSRLKRIFLKVDQAMDEIGQRQRDLAPTSLRTFVERSNWSLPQHWGGYQRSVEDLRWQRRQQCNPFRPATDQEVHDITSAWERANQRIGDTAAKWSLDGAGLCSGWRVDGAVEGCWHAPVRKELLQHLASLSVQPAIQDGLLRMLEENGALLLRRRLVREILQAYRTGAEEAVLQCFNDTMPQLSQPVSRPHLEPLQPAVSVGCAEKLAQNVAAKLWEQLCPCSSSDSGEVGGAFPLEFVREEASEVGQQLSTGVGRQLLTGLCSSWEAEMHREQRAETAARALLRDGDLTRRQLLLKELQREASAAYAMSQEAWKRLLDAMRCVPQDCQGEALRVLQATHAVRAVTREDAVGMLACPPSGGLQLASFNPFLAEGWLHEPLRATLRLEAFGTRLCKLTEQLAGSEPSSSEERQLAEVLEAPSRWTHRDSWQQFEWEAGLSCRALQLEVADRMVDPDFGGKVLQLNMGEGKSKVILPLLCAALADGKQLVCVVVLHSLLELACDHLRVALGGLLGRRIYVLPFERKTRVSVEAVGAIRQQLEECAQQGGVLLITPEERLSLELKFRESCLSSPAAEFQQDLAVIFREYLCKAVWLVDESDEVLRLRYQLIYTLGARSDLHGGRHRWEVPMEIFRLLKCDPRVQEHLCSLEREGRASASLTKGPTGAEFPGVQFHDVPREHPTFAQILEALTERLFQVSEVGELPLAGLRGRSGRLRVNMRLFVLNLAETEVAFDKLAAELQGVAERQANPGLWDVLLLLRGWFAGDLLRCVLHKRHRVDFGVDDRTWRREMAVPFRFKDAPSERTEFGHPDLAVGLTLRSYYWTGLTESQMKWALRHLQGLERVLRRRRYQRFLLAAATSSLSPERAGADSEAEAVRMRLNLPDDLCDLDLEKEEVFARLHKLFRANMQVVDFYLAERVLPGETRQFPGKVIGNAWDLAAVGSVRGFSGTCDNQQLLPRGMEQGNLGALRHTDGRMLRLLLDPGLGGPAGVQPLASLGPRDVLKEILEAQNRSVSVLIDCGALLTGLSNRDVAKVALDLHETFRGAVYFADGTGRPEVLDRHGVSVPLATSPLQPADGCFTYLDDQHTRGTDLRFGKWAVGAVTVCRQLNKDRLVQAAMRMRGLGAGQTVTFFVNSEAQRQLREELKHDAGATAAGVLAWTLANTARAAQAAVPDWVLQGAAFAVRSAAQAAILAERTMAAEILPRLACLCCEQELHSLQQLYAQWLEQREACEVVPKQARRFLGTLLAQAGSEGEEEAAKLRPQAEVQVSELLQLAQPFLQGLRVTSHALEEEHEREVEAEREVEHEVVRELEQPSAPPGRREPAQEESWDWQSVLEPDFVEAGLAGRRGFPRLSELAPGTVDEGGAGLPALAELRSLPRSLLATTNFLSVLAVPSSDSTDFLRPVDCFLVWVRGAPAGQLQDLRQCAHVVLLSGREADHLLPRLRYSLTKGRVPGPTPTSPQVWLGHLADVSASMCVMGRQPLGPCIRKLPQPLPADWRIPLRVFNGECRYGGEDVMAVREYLGLLARTAFRGCWATQTQTQMQTQMQTQGQAQAQAPVLAQALAQAQEQEEVGAQVSARLWDELYDRKLIASNGFILQPLPTPQMVESALQGALLGIEDYLGEPDRVIFAQKATEVLAKLIVDSGTNPQRPLHQIVKSRGRWGSYRGSDLESILDG